MTVSVNPVHKENNDAQLIMQALGLAKDLYRINLDDKSSQYAEKLKAEADQAKEGRQFEGQYEAVPAGSKGAVSSNFKLPSGITTPQGQTWRLRSVGESERSQAQKDIDRKRSDKERLISDYGKESEVSKTSLQQLSSMERLYSEGKEGTDDIAMLYAFSKGLDPRGIVTESDFQNAASGGGLLPQAQMLFNQVTEGKPLRQDQKDNLMRTIRLKVAGTLEGQKEIDDKYKEIAHNMGLEGKDIKEIVDDRFSKTLSRLNQAIAHSNKVPKTAPSGGDSFDVSKIDQSGLAPEVQAAIAEKMRRKAANTAGN